MRPALLACILAAWLHACAARPAAPLEKPEAAPLASAGPEVGLESLPVLEDAAVPRFEGDWLIETPTTHCLAYRRPGGMEIVLTNGLVRRVFTLARHSSSFEMLGIATTGIDQLVTGESFVRAVEPEALLTIDGNEIRVGGLEGQGNRAFLRREDLEKLRVPLNAFALTGVDTGPIPERMFWKRARRSEGRPWPPRGLRLTLTFAPLRSQGFPDCRVFVHHDVYEGLPLLGKSVEIDRSSTGEPALLNALQCERLAVVEPQSSVEDPKHWLESNLEVLTDIGMFGQDRFNGTGCVRWETEPEFTTQVNYALKTPCRLVCGPPLGPDVELGAPDALRPRNTATFFSPNVFELLHDSHDRERRGLALRRTYRTLAPWCTENPILMHARDADPKAVRLAIDQCAEAGFEMLILSFGSGIDMESEDPAYRASIRELVDYARSKHVELGGYSLLASRSISAEDDVIDPKSGKPGHAIFGSSPCLGSKWGQQYFRKVEDFLVVTGMTVLEHDGSYPGDVCASTTHPGHRGLADSQWTQWRTISDFYARCRARGIYLNVPDWYFLAGSNKSAMGYRETNWSLPRDEQVLHARQNIYDGTWTKTPTMGWMFVPLTEYQGGGAAATIEPLHEHLDAYEAHLANNFGAGAQACWRGPRLFDTDETQALVKKWVDFYKRHRAILDADLVHLRRADGRDWDGWLHVDPALDERGLAMIYNPLDRELRTTIRIPLHYTGLRGRVLVSHEDGAAESIELDDERRARLEVAIPANGRTWFVFRAR